MLNGVHTFWIMLTSVLDCISFAWVDHNLSCNGSLLYSLFLKWLNPNHFPSICEYHSPILPITVKRFSVLKTNGCFHACLVSHTKVKLIFLSLGGHLCLIFENGWLAKSITDWNNENEQVTLWVWEIYLNVTGWLHLTRWVTVGWWKKGEIVVNERLGWRKGLIFQSTHQMFGVSDVLS